MTALSIGTALTFKFVGDGDLPARVVRVFLLNFGVTGAFIADKLFISLLFSLMILVAFEIIQGTIYINNEYQIVICIKISKLYTLHFSNTYEIFSLFLWFST